MEVPFSRILQKGENPHQVMLSYPHDMVLERDMRTRHKGRDLGPSCLMRFLPKVGHMLFKETQFQNQTPKEKDPSNLSQNQKNQDQDSSKKAIKPEFSIGDLGQVIPPNALDFHKYKSKKIVPHEQLIETLEIMLQDKVYGPNPESLLVLLGTSKETFFNVFQAFCGFESERIFSRLEGVDLDRELERNFRKKRKRRERRLRKRKEMGQITETQFEERLQDIYRNIIQERQQTRTQQVERLKNWKAEYQGPSADSQNVLLVFDLFANVKEHYNSVNVSGESVLRKVLEYIEANALENTRVVVIGAHSNKITGVELEFLEKNGTDGKEDFEFNQKGESRVMDVWTIEHLLENQTKLPELISSYL